MFDGVRADYLFIFIYLFIYLLILGRIFSGFFYHCVSIVISFNFISLMIHFIVELIFRSTDNIENIGMGGQKLESFKG